MPQWFLALWIAARDMVGSSITSISSGISGYVATTSTKALAFLDSLGNQPTDLSDESIVMRAAAPTSLASPGPHTLIIGNMSGQRMGPSTAGKNVIVGYTAQINASKLDISNAVVVGNLARIDDTSSAATASGAVCIGYGNTSMAGRNVVVGSGISYSYGSTTQRDITYRTTAVGAGMSVQFFPNVAAYTAAGTLVGHGGVHRIQNNSTYGIMDLFGSNNSITVTTGAKADVSLIGSCARMGWTGSSAWRGSPDMPSVMRLAKGLSTTSGGGTASQAGIDIIAGSTINSSLVLLGGGIDTEANGSIGTNAANTAYRYALADMGKVKDATGAAATIPDNCSTYILKSTTSSGTIVPITFPANPIDGQLLTLICGEDYMGLNLVPNTGQSIKGGMGNFTAGEACTWIYDAPDATWYRRG